MAYQPMLGPIIGGFSVITTGTEYITLPDAGTFYLVLAGRLQASTESGRYTVPLESLSVLSGNARALWYRIVFNAELTGDPLVYSPSSPTSVTEGAIGNGTQTATGGFYSGVGRYVPPRLERGLPRPIADIAVPVNQGSIAMLLVSPVENNARVYAHADFSEILLDDNGIPVQRLDVAFGL